MENSPGFFHHSAPLTVQSCLAPVEIFISSFLHFVKGEKEFQFLFFSALLKVWETNLLPELLLWGDEAGVEDVGKSCAADIKYSPRWHSRWFFLLGIVSLVSFYFAPQENLTTKLARLGTYYVYMGLYGCSWYKISLENSPILEWVSCLMLVKSDNLMATWQGTCVPQYGGWGWGVLA